MLEWRVTKANYPWEGEFELHANSLVTRFANQSELISAITALERAHAKRAILLDMITETSQ